MKLHIGDKVYPWGGSSGVPLIHLIRLQRELGIGETELGLMQRAEQARRMKYQAELEIAETEGREPPPVLEADLYLFGITVWLCRLTAGEKLTFEEACDFDTSILKFVPDPEDEVDEQVDPTSPVVKPRKSSGKSRPHGEAAA